MKLTVMDLPRRLDRECPDSRRGRLYAQRDQFLPGSGFDERSGYRDTRPLIDKAVGDNVLNTKADRRYRLPAGRTHGYRDNIRCVSP